MDQAEELKRLKAQLAALKASIGQKNSGPKQTGISNFHATRLVR